MSTPTDDPAARPEDEAPDAAGSPAPDAEQAGAPDAEQAGAETAAPLVPPPAGGATSAAPPLPSWAGTPTGETPVVPADLPRTPVAEPAAETPGAGQHAAPRPYPPAPTVTRVSSAETLAAQRAGLESVPPGTPATADGAQTAIAPPPLAPAAPVAQTAVTPPPPAPAPTEAATTTALPTPADGPVTPVPAAPVTAPQPAEGPRAPAHEPVDLPEPPAKPGAARHVLGVLVGLVLTPVALVLAAVGAGRFLAVDDAAAASFDLTGLGLLLIGALLLGVVVLLGLWSPAVPLTGGLVWGVGLGVVYVGWPQLVEDALDSAYSTRPPALDQLTSTLNDGTWLLLGVLVAVAGLAVAIARRMGRRFGERRVIADHARADAAKAEEARRRAADAEEAARAERARAVG